MTAATHSYSTPRPAPYASVTEVLDGLPAGPRAEVQRHYAAAGGSVAWSDRDRALLAQALLQHAHALDRERGTYEERRARLGILGALRARYERLVGEITHAAHDGAAEVAPLRSDVRPRVTCKHPELRRDGPVLSCSRCGRAYPTPVSPDASTGQR